MRSVGVGGVDMRRGIVVAVAGLLLATFLVFGSAEASVPGLEFTETGCEGYSDSVARLYKAGLNREPDKAGFEYWLVLYQEGELDLRAMAGLFTESAEFSQRYGLLNNTDFVRLLYQNVLGREGEPAGVVYWVGQLESGRDRGSVLLMFAESTENIRATGTTDPILGAFNFGLQGPWTCVPTQPTTTTTTTQATTTTTRATTTTPQATTTTAGPPHGSSDLHNCGDFSSQAAAQNHFRQLYEAGYGDIDRLDGNNDGVACESNPSPRDTRPPDNF